MPAPLSPFASGDVYRGKLIKKVNVDYPLAARAQKVPGLVVIQAVIGKDGRVLDDLHVVSGPSELRTPAIDAVRQWVYEPYLLNGTPVEADILIRLLF